MTVNFYRILWEQGRRKLKPGSGNAPEEVVRKWLNVEINI